MRLSPCNCSEGNYQRLPRRWWMRLLPGTVRYRCKSCRARMLLRTRTASRSSVAQVFLTVLVSVLAIAVTIYAVDYFQEAADRRWKDSVQNQ